MSGQVVQERAFYTSCYRHGVDEKRRVQIPAKWRPVEEGTELTVILWAQHQVGTCLRVLPPAQMDKMMAEIDAMPNGDQKMALKRYIGAGSERVALDKGGRICLPVAMANSAGIKEEAVLVGLLDRFEIWSPDRYQNVESADAVMAQTAFKLIG